MKIILRLGLVCFFLPLLGIKSFADNLPDVTKMVNMSFEDLLNTTVTSAAGREQKINDVANAMYVITKEDIERSGAREVADLLYRVPGLQIREIDGYQYDIGIRGHSSYITNNILVLIDGAVFFNPFLDGTVWENLPISLNEIERIEIIRGSPGVLYSSNAVNGVINIITKSADTKDNYVSQEGGTQSFRDSSIGLGGKIGTSGLALRAFLDNQFEQGFIKSSSLLNTSDRYLSDRDGARLDYTPSDHQRLTVIANNNQQNSNGWKYALGSPAKLPGETTSAIINYTDKVTDMYDFSFHFDHVEQLTSAFIPDDVIVHTTSASIQNNFHYDLAGSHVTSVGGELRYNALHVAKDDNAPGQMGPGLVSNSTATQRIISFFAQDEYRPIDKLILTAGVREDSNTLVIDHAPLYSPKVSALYKLTDNDSIWVSDSHTYRTPSFFDHDLSLFGGAYRGSTDLKPESDWTQEVGYRGLFLDQKLKVDTTLFTSKIEDVIILEQDAPFAPNQTSNNGSLTSYGAELALDYQLTQNLSLSTDYSYIYSHSKPETPNTPFTLSSATSPSENIAGLGARYTLNKLKLDLYAKYFEGYTDPTANIAFPKAKNYITTSFRVSYDFQTPTWSGRLNATVYLEASDFISSHEIESNQDNVSIGPKITSGIKIKF